MAEFPEFTPKYVEDESSVRARFDADANPDTDKREGSHYYNATEPMVKECARLWDIDNDVLAGSTYLFANDIYLDYHAEQVGVYRNPAVAASGMVHFTGTEGAAIPSGTRVSTVALTETDTPIRFLTTVAGIISGGVADIPVVAEEPGAAGNVGANTVTFLEDSNPAIASVNNPAGITSGADQEDDEALREKIALRVASPAGAGNVAAYKAWVRDYPGVGSNITVIPRWNGVNSVKVILLDTNNNPLSQAALDGVQQLLTGTPHLANPTAAPTAALVAGALTGTFQYAVSFSDGGGETKLSPFVQVSPASQQVNLSAIPLGPAGTTRRYIYRRAGTTGTFFRQGSILDNTTTTFSDNTPAAGTIPAQKTNSTTTYDDATVPVGADVVVDTPTQVAINVAATVTHKAGYSYDGGSGTVATRQAITDAVNKYINSLAPGDDVIYKNVEAVIFSVEGVYDITVLTVQAGTANVAISTSEVADAGSVTLS